MFTLVYPADSRESDNRIGQPRPSPQVWNQEATPMEVRRNDNVATVRSLYSPHRLAEDAHGSHLVNFPFAFSVFLILTMGLTVVGLGIIVTNVWLVGTGFFTTLVGCLLYSLVSADDSPDDI